MNVFASWAQSTGAADELNPISSNSLSSCLAHQNPQTWACDLAVSTATCRHSAHSWEVLQTSHFPAQDAGITQWVPAQQVHLWQEAKP